MKRFDEHFRDMLVRSEYISISGKIVEGKVVLSGHPDIFSIHFFRFLWKVSSDSEDFEEAEK